MTTQLPAEILAAIEQRFKDIHEAKGTEARVLIYRSENGALRVTWPAVIATPTSVRIFGDTPDSFLEEGVWWDLAYDLHSHHVMGAFWSPTDNFNERRRNVVFGVFSWRRGYDTWLFRTFDGKQFVDLTHEEVSAA